LVVGWRMSTVAGGDSNSGEKKVEVGQIIRCLRGPDSRIEGGGDAQKRRGRQRLRAGAFERRTSTRGHVWASDSAFGVGGTGRRSKLPQKAEAKTAPRTPPDATVRANKRKPYRGHFWRTVPFGAALFTARQANGRLGCRGRREWGVCRGRDMCHGIGNGGAGGQTRGRRARRRQNRRAIPRAGRAEAVAIRRGGAGGMIPRGSFRGSPRDPAGGRLLGGSVEAGPQGPGNGHTPMIGPR